MTKKKLTIPEFRLSRYPHSGVALKNLDLGQMHQADHNVHLAHRDDHYMLVLIRDGRLKACVDFEEHECLSPGLLMIFPGQVHQISPQSELSGWALNFDAAVINEDIKDALEKQWRNVAPFIADFPGVWFEEIDQLLGTISYLYTQPSIASQKAIKALLPGLLYVIIGNLPVQPGIPQEKKGRSALIKQQFLHLLYEQYKDWKKPSAYAQQLHITTAHLNDTIKKLIGRSATEVIQQHCILEARRLLYYTDLDIKEIGCQIGYFNSSHFIKIFKSVTGLTPVQFRQTST